VQEALPKPWLHAQENTHIHMSQFQASCCRDNYQQDLIAKDNPYVSATQG
jgi:hypothetical protein